MSVLNKLFGKKKNSFKAFCSVSKEPLEKGYGFLLTTSEVISSYKYWDNIMTEPETMSYTINHFTKGDNTSTRIRSMIFEKYAEVNEPWMVSDSYIKWFDVDHEKARELAQKWWENEGSFVPDNNGAASTVLSPDQFQEIRTYAIMEAGRERVED